MHLIHKHEPVAVSHMNAMLGGGTMSTEVLWRCPCGNLKTQRLPGKWELAAVRGETAEPVQLRRADAA